ncbi:MAG: flagellar export chaperone FliS [Candidatus Omnitrophica bacterium]|nr:flagellar export chaperone FliS [Candidatus Omnitrophota bacterium]
METGRHESQKYRLEKLKSASDLEALIILYDEAVSRLNEARQCFEEKNIKRMKEQIEMTKKIIRGLVGILDFQANREMAGNLYKIYEYILRRLGVAEVGIRQTPKILEEAGGHLSQLREAWIAVQEKGDVTEGFKVHLTSEDRNFLNIEI